MRWKCLQNLRILVLSFYEMRYICFLILFVLSSSAFGNEVLNIGVASNFYEPIKIIKDKAFSLKINHVFIFVGLS